MKTNQTNTNEIEWSVIQGENTEFAVQYPRMQWVHGEKKASGFNQSGGLFISNEQYPKFEAAGFKPEIFISRKDEIPGAAAASAQIAVIRIKHQWVKDEGRNVPLVHALIVAKGCEDLLCLSLRGASKALDFQKAFNQHMSHNVALANRTRPENAKPVEPFALWFPIEAGELQTITSKDGKNESNVTVPTLSQPKELDRDYIVSLWVGAESYKQFAAYFRETAAWQKLPIWEQRADDTPEYTGDLATQGQIEHIVGICEAKGLDVKELVLTATAGGSNNPGTLTRDEAANIIETAKAY